MLKAAVKVCVCAEIPKRAYRRLLEEEAVEEGGCWRRRLLKKEAVEEGGC